MKLDEIEQSIITNGINNLLINARLMSLENVFWGYINPILEKRNEGDSKEYRKIFLNFYHDNITELQKLLPPSLAENKVIETKLEEELENVRFEIDSLDFS